MDEPSTNLQPHENAIEELTKCSETPPTVLIVGMNVLIGLGVPFTTWINFNLGMDEWLWPLCEMKSLIYSQTSVV